MLTHRQRVRAVLAGERPDKPIADMGGRVVSLSLPVYKELKAYLGYGSELETETVTVLATIGEFDPRVLEYFDIPIRRLYLRSASNFKIKVQADGSFKDEWHTTRKPMGDYNARINPPLANAALADLDHFSWPDPHDPGRTEGLADEAQRLFETSDYSLAAGHISAGVFQDCWNLRGMEQFLVDMHVDRAFAETMLDKVLDIHIKLWMQFLDCVGEYVDIVETADDLGTQMGLLISPQMYRDLVKPRHAALNEAIRSRTDAKILFHTCGAVMPLIGDLIEIGVDILNPIQPLPGLMDPEELKSRFGEQLIFHGGLDVQSLLPNGTPQEVAASVKHYLDVLGPERYVMGPANTIQPGTPPQNIIAAYKAVQDYG